MLLLLFAYFSREGKTQSYDITLQSVCSDLCIRCKQEVVTVQSALSKRKTLFTGKSGLNVRKKLVNVLHFEYSFLYGVETCTLREVDQNYLESFVMWCWRRIEKIGLNYGVKNVEVLEESWRR